MVVLRLNFGAFHTVRFPRLFSLSLKAALLSLLLSGCGFSQFRAWTDVN
jgi:hypothetical protein